MKCKHCEDVGELFVPGRIINCPYCQSVTNEEYLRSLNTEQKAEWIASVVQKAISIKESNGIVMLESAIWWDEWLKQPHTPKE